MKLFLTLFRFYQVLFHRFPLPRVKERPDDALVKETARQVLPDEEMEELFSNKAKLLDLEDLSFQQGSHFMSNKKCSLPEG